jgi:hypothetical protein
MAVIGPRNARRLAMLVEDGTLRRMGRVEEVLGVVERYGDRALDFVWRHKGALTVGTLLAAFLRDPASFLGGTRESAVPAGEAVGTSLGGAVERGVEGLVRPGMVLWFAVIAGLATGLARCIQRRPVRPRG